MHIHISRFAVLALAGLVLTAGMAQAEEISYADNYPGLKSRGGAVDVADSQVRNAVKAFQLVYGRNPETWAEVLASGLFDNELLGYGMQRIDPDDSSIDFMGDLSLRSEPATGIDNQLLLLNYWNTVTLDVGAPMIEMHERYEDLLRAAGESQDLDADQLSIIDAWLGDDGQMIQFGHVRQLTYAVLIYQAINGVYPATLQDLVDSGVGPLRAGALNPVTHEAYRYDGSKGDISYELMDEGMGFKLRHVDLVHDVDFEHSY